MRVEVSAELEAAIMVAAKIAPVRGSRPELQQLTLSTGDGCSKLEASDGELSLCYRYEPARRSVDVARIPAHRIAAILKATRDDAGEAILELDGDCCRVKTDGSRFTLVAERSASSYSTPGFDDELGDVVRLEAEILTELVALVGYAASREKNRYAMEAIRIELDASAKKIQAIATDGRRLAVATAKVEADDSFSTQVSASSLMAATKILETLSPRDQLEIKTTSSRLLLRSGDVELSLLTIAGDFAPWRQVIPDASTHQIEFDRADLIQAIKLASLCASKESLAIRFGVGPDGVRITSKTADVGEACVEMPALSIAAELELGFNPAFLVEAFKACSCDSILFAFSDSSSAAVITCAESLEGRPDLLYVLMPINLGA